MTPKLKPGRGPLDYARRPWIMALFALPIVASYLVHHFHRPEATGNYGELLLPLALPAGTTTLTLEYQW